MLSATDFPAREVRLVEPFGTGGGPDLLGRALAPQLSELWGQEVTVENRPGAGSTVGPAYVAEAPADGHTLLINTSAHAYSAALAADLPYDPLRDFVAVAPLTSQPYVLVTGAEAGITSVEGLIAAARATPGLTFASSGVGTGTHVGIELLNRAAGIAALHAPAGGADAITDTLARTAAGDAAYALSPIALALPEIRDGVLVPLGVSGARRSPLLPDVPTVAEAGVPGFDFPVWYGLWAPAGTPDDVVALIAADVPRALTAPEVREWLAEHGADLMDMPPSDFARYVSSESERAASIIEPR